MSARAAFTLLIFAITALSFVLPIPNASPDREHYNNALNRLNPMQTTNNLVCRSSRQSMSCYGGPAVTLQTCQTACTCENGRISCPSYKYCDDSTMDTFCGGLCQCASAGGPSSAPSPEKKPEIVISPHRYPPPRIQHDDDDDDDYTDDDDEDDLRKRNTRRTTKRSTDMPLAGASLS